MCKILKWKGNNSVRKEIFMTSLKRKLIKLVKENLQLGQDYLKRSLDWTGENGKCEMLILHAAPIPEDGTLSGKSID